MTARTTTTLRWQVRDRHGNTYPCSSPERAHARAERWSEQSVLAPFTPEQVTVTTTVEAL